MLLSTRVFTSLSLISLLTAPLLVFVQVLPSLYQSIACFDRIESYCVKAPVEVSDEVVSTHKLDLPESIPMQVTDTQEPAIEFHNASFAWHRDDVPILKDIYFSIKRGSITAIIGPVGSGKSTLLESALGETELIKGSFSSTPSAVAYCPQTAWIINDTIRQNITGPLAFEANWYKFVIWACSLDKDIEDIPGGDLSKAGSSGVTLSGGQKQRIVSEGICTS
jgi:ATP-binding cassette subfamily C (CFTR/MRP) protein 1